MGWGMRVRLGWAAIGALLLCMATQVLAAADIKDMRVWRAPDNTRLVFDLSGPVKASVFTLTAPNRIVIDLSGAKLSTQLNEARLKGTPITGLRSAQRTENDLRVVLDVAQPVTPKSFTLAPNQQYGDRLVVDLYDQGADISADVPATPTPERPSTPVSPAQPKVTVPAGPSGKRDVIVVIDAGHGGEDPGAVAQGGGLFEKNITLAIARKLQAQINQMKGYRAELTRTGDYFIPLRKRTEIARKKGADLFISIHADAAPNRSASGVSVFALSQRGATSETARWLADTENSSDLIGGVGSALDTKDQMLAGVLLDLSMTSTLSSSLDVGQKVLTSMGQQTKLLHRKVEQAAFVVLKSPDIPSILVETGFISNPSESTKLASSRHQELLARQIRAGVSQYFQRSPPPGTYLAWLRDQKGQQLATGNP
ncbi:N-acetylmuramoyl-L-alanine amidase [Pseudomonas duriflava]|uniref:N-acetylmuramoyl-L-alanine amidase AmiC n=1 Tax=Pseudomonas duriflava TaxID=459528 RepID=A0A562Q6K4_9PSED|nr:N-acetylmuramoyl-L-alanine amidase [Pseudomonas duriflava]